MKIAWEETIAEMRRLGIEEETIEEFRRDWVATTARLLDRGKEVPIFFEHRGLIIQLKGDMALRCFTLSEDQ